MDGAVIAPAAGGGMIPSKPEDLLPPAACLPGRQHPLPDAPGPDAVHRVFGTPMHPPWPFHMEVAFFGMGCVWCTEAVLIRQSPPGALFSTQCGYANGVTPNPTNTEVHTGCTNHVEVVRTIFDPEKVSFAQLCSIFFEAHDPTTPNRQGPDDIGTEYRSAILCTSPEQLATARRAADVCGRLIAVHKLCLPGARIVTDIAPLTSFFLAEEEHQQHDWRPGVRAGCGLQPTCVTMPEPPWL